jgi:hypothetical protein
MRRWLGIMLAIGFVSTSASAQVFKPKSKKAAATEKKSADPEKKTAKKQPRAGATKKRPKKKSSASDRGTADDLTPEPESKSAGKDYVKIWDDDEIE